jgi:hypothetical protein
MNSSFPRNINNKGRLLRGIGALALGVGAAFCFPCCVWVGVTLLAGGLFLAFEALRGWCALRACGIRTKL